jgi:hypothetical protein
MAVISFMMQVTGQLAIENVLKLEKKVFFFLKKLKKLFLGFATFSTHWTFAIKHCAGYIMVQ